MEGMVSSYEANAYEHQSKAKLISNAEGDRARPLSSLVAPVVELPVAGLLASHY